MDATFGEYKEAFCVRFRVEPPKLLPSEIIERLPQEGYKPCGIAFHSFPRLKDSVEARTDEGEGVVTDGKHRGVPCRGWLAHCCGSVRYQREVGVYHGVLISKVDKIIAIGNPPSA